MTKTPTPLAALRLPRPAAAVAPRYSRGVRGGGA